MRGVLNCATLVLHLSILFWKEVFAMKLQHVTPESVGVPSQAVLDLLDEFYRQGVEMHGLMLLRHGQVYAEGHWAPYNAQTPHILFSFSKS